MTEQELQILENMMGRIEQCEKIEAALVPSLKKLADSFNIIEAEFGWFKNNYIYEVVDAMSKELPHRIPNILSCEDTLKELKEKDKSICRYGDGEFACISGKLRGNFTKMYNEKLAKRLVEVLHSSDENIMIAIADNYGSLEKYCDQSKREIRAYMTDTIRRDHEELLEIDRVYYNAYITRPYIMYKDKSNAAARFAELKEIWQDKDCIFIEGEKTRLGIGNDLFDNCRSIRRILAPAVDAFSRYDEILNASLSFDVDALYIIALGPTATVLAYDLAISGRRAIDIGHIDIEYEWFKKNCDRRCEIQGKFNNEFPGGDIVSDIEDSTYDSQIIKRII